MSVKINHDCIVCGTRFMHDVDKACICEYCLEEPKNIEDKIKEVEESRQSWITEAERRSEEIVSLKKKIEGEDILKMNMMAAKSAAREYFAEMIVRIQEIHKIQKGLRRAQNARDRYKAELDVYKNGGAK